MKFYTEVALSVSDFYEGDIDEAFENCAKATELAQDVFTDMLKDEEHIASIESVEFLEFDSSNWTHAGAYFEIKYESESEFNYYD